MRHPCFVLCALALTAGVPAATCAAPAPSGVSPTDIRFAALDGDGDGRVTWEEFHKANESIARQGFDIIDADKNGHISLEEWRAFAANHGMDIAMPSTGTTLPGASGRAANDSGPRASLFAAGHAPGRSRRTPAGERDQPPRSTRRSGRRPTRPGARGRRLCPSSCLRPEMPPELRRRRSPLPRPLPGPACL